MKVPALGAVTLTVIVQEPLAGIKAGVNLLGGNTVDKITVEPPASALRDELPHVVAALGVAAITMPLGNVSTKFPGKMAAVALALLKVMERVETPPASMVAGLKDLLSVGGIGVTGGTPHTAAATLLESSVTAPFRARTLPDTFAPVLRVMLVSARMLPTNEVVVPRVAELPTCQKTLQD
jgi:hypothetical protein